jgi:NCAIR mutase (PurE)-related protein
MDKQELTRLLESVAAGSVTPDEAALQLKLEPFHEVGGYARVDFHRGIRQGVPEVIYGEGKTKEHILGIMRVEAAGYGTGKKDFPAANVVRALLGETV